MRCSLRQPARLRSFLRYSMIRRRRSIRRSKECAECRDAWLWQSPPKHAVSGLQVSAAPKSKIELQQKCGARVTRDMSARSSEHVVNARFCTNRKWDVLTNTSKEPA